jgi:hypothetical protein
VTIVDNSSSFAKLKRTTTMMKWMITMKISPIVLFDSIQVKVQMRLESFWTLPLFAFVLMVLGLDV